MNALIVELTKKADHFYGLYQHEMKFGRADWAIKYEYQWHGVRTAIDIVKKHQKRKTGVIV